MLKVYFCRNLSAPSPLSLATGLGSYNLILAIFLINAGHSLFAIYDKLPENS